MARHEGWLGTYPSHVSIRHKQADLKKFIMAVSIVLTLARFRLRSRPRYGNSGASASEVARHPHNSSGADPEVLPNERGDRP